jgi:hypothetical protein
MVLSISDLKNSIVNDATTLTFALISIIPCFLSLVLPSIPSCMILELSLISILPTWFSYSNNATTLTFDPEKHDGDHVYQVV